MKAKFEQQAFFRQISKHLYNFHACGATVGSSGGGTISVIKNHAGENSFEVTKTYGRGYIKFDGAEVSGSKFIATISRLDKRTGRGLATIKKDWPLVMVGSGSDFGCYIGDSTPEFKSVAEHNEKTCDSIQAMVWDGGECRLVPIIGQAPFDGQECQNVHPGSLEKIDDQGNWNCREVKWNPDHRPWCTSEIVEQKTQSTGYRKTKPGEHSIGPSTSPPTGASWSPAQNSKCPFAPDSPFDQTEVCLTGNPLGSGVPPGKNRENLNVTGTKCCDCNCELASSCFHPNTISGTWPGNCSCDPPICTCCGPTCVCNPGPCSPPPPPPPCTCCGPSCACNPSPCSPPPPPPPQCTQPCPTSGHWIKNAAPPCCTCDSTKVSTALCQAQGGKTFDQANCKCALTACSCTDPNKVPPQGATQPNCPPCVCKPPFPAVGDPCPADLNNKVVDTVNQNTCTHTCKSKTCNPALPAVGGPCPADPTNKVVDAVDQSNCTHTCKPTCQAPKKIIGGVCKCDDCPNSTDTQDPNTCACTSPPPKCSNPLVPNTCAVGTPGRYYQNPGLPGQVHHQWDCTSGGIPLTCHKTTGCNKQCSYPKELNSNTCQCVCRQSAIDMCNGLGRTIDNNCQCNQPACSPPQGGCPSTRPDWDQGSCSCQCNISANDCPDPCQDPNTSSCSCECQTGCQDGMSSCFHSP